LLKRVEIITHKSQLSKRSESWKIDF